MHCIKRHHDSVNSFQRCLNSNLGALLLTRRALTKGGHRELPKVCGCVDGYNCIMLLTMSKQSSTSAKPTLGHGLQKLWHFLRQNFLRISARKVIGYFLMYFFVEAGYICTNLGDLLGATFITTWSPGMAVTFLLLSNGDQHLKFLL